ncbi:hypothetical protein HPB48_009816 [Haemaphysalis longicornis]|uniref:Uncharacterized protein n=1 Tax=Haemaphysalis longicornis TaxID=44386 RepID=A0A9J6H431_HAELO|nr:hypothetical protein HPB48_009816 [Haemaphysalis longicornis]
MHTPTGRTFLRQLGYMEQIRKMSNAADIPGELRRTFHVTPIPKNMYPNFHKGRRKARVDFVRRRLSTKKRNVRGHIYITSKESTQGGCSGRLKAQLHHQWLATSLYCGTRRGASCHSGSAEGFWTSR